MDFVYHRHSPLHILQENLLENLAYRHNRNHTQHLQMELVQEDMDHPVPSDTTIYY